MYLALGSNLGDRAAHLAHARARLDALPGVRVAAASPVEETAPLGPAGQDPYLNQMLALRTTLEPEALLDACLAVEAERGRDRAASPRWGARTLDLDVVLFGARRVATPRLRVPHPELPNRDFWHRGLAALGVDWREALAAVPA
ncbi:2-amino-4-hydroxy-6-hydroxymethyldihydropteridine diphosphokinase [Roseisolibacter sp. H3M3-2]|uniref:2-amino-4-hydroxy-6- hydroxymethyldihydropteridine diphosphokinase n=1 Tax=Roseisolibacter sp. H3M3-2 TaxID=3031323 RepID=UPI0023DBEB3A|nr:2-amino-4-hydroxy-6-hydroxymethyldihydropteridine diphosphokinase [Roseisolibacter sp. H3M3-2]MDF1501536.1 2-amino-4-hydroxy-6-hydroxymethyldihydropteridine diphosphokinase [Roseisolibacter sp. H3M3-2]